MQLRRGEKLPHKADVVSREQDSAYRRGGKTFGYGFENVPGNRLIYPIRSDAAFLMHRRDSGSGRLGEDDKFDMTADSEDREFNLFLILSDPLSISSCMQAWKELTKHPS